MIRKAWDILKSLVYPMPSLFDVVICLGIIPIGYFGTDFRGFYLVYFSILTLIISLTLKQERRYSNVWLFMILCWFFISIFIHSWVVNVNSMCFKYLNFYLMSEGFIYALFGILLLMTIIKYCRNLRLLLITTPIALIPLFNKSVHCGQMSYVMAIFLAVCIYALIKNRWTLAFIMLSSAVIITVANFSWLVMKFNCRPYIFIELGRQILQHPFVGTGFNKFLQPDNMTWVREIGDFEYGWLFRHNDYLSISAFIGLPILIGIIGYLATLIYQWRNSWKLMPLLSFVIVCFFQITLFDAYKALIILTTLGWLYIEA